MSDKPLNFLCFGMGAIGTYIGGSLAAAGYKVTFIERPESFAKVKGRGLRIQIPSGEMRVPEVIIYSSLDEAVKKEKFDIALLAVKSFDTNSVLEKIQPWKESFPTVLCLQNGVENEPMIEAVLGANRVIGASITTAVGKSGLGDVSVEKMRGIGIESVHPLATRVIESFNRAGLHASGYSKRADLKWSKMLTNLLGNATSAILNWTPAQIFADKEIYQVEVQQIREALAVMARLNIHLVNLPGTPISPLVWMMDKMPAWISQPVRYRALGRGRGKKMPSFHIDLYAGQTRSEVSFLNGAVVRAGESLDIPTPVNSVLTRTLEELASGKLEKHDFADHPQKLISLIKETT